jgi:hypothetical protein
MRNTCINIPCNFFYLLKTFSRSHLHRRHFVFEIAHEHEVYPSVVLDADSAKANLKVV